MLLVPPFWIPHRGILFDPYASGCVGLIHCEAMFEIFVIILHLQATITIRIGFWITLSFLWIILSQHFYTCHLLVGGPFWHGLWTSSKFVWRRRFNEQLHSTPPVVFPCGCWPHLWVYGLNSWGLSTFGFG